MEKFNEKFLNGAPNVTGMSKILWYFSSLSTQNANEMADIFKRCISLLYLPDISKCNTQKLIHFKVLFEDCKEQ